MAGCVASIPRPSFHTLPARLRDRAAPLLASVTQTMSGLRDKSVRVWRTAIATACEYLSRLRRSVSAVAARLSVVRDQLKQSFDRWVEGGALFPARHAERARLLEESPRKGSSRTMAQELAAIMPPPPVTPFLRLRALAAGAFAVVGVFVVGFGVWAVFAPLESAAIAGGAIEAESSRKTIQHLEGGIVARILVKDGDRVAAGQPLIRLDDTKPQATVQMLQMQLWDAQALEARLLAERGDLGTIQFPSTIRPAARNAPALADIIAGQIKIFDTRRKLLASRIEVVERRKAQDGQEIESARFQAQAAAKRVAIIKDEIGVVAPLVAKRLQARGRLTQLEREQAEIEGRLGDAQARMAKARQSQGEAEAMILQLESDHQTEIAQSLRDARAQIFELHERIQAANDVLARTVVRAPEAGTVTDLRIHTPGGVVAAGEPLLDLVPGDDRLIVQAQVKPEDIDLVRPGLDARIRLLSYKHRRVPPVDGVLTYVSADRLVDKETERSYYEARIRIDEASLHSLPEVEIMPGMPVEVLIKTGEFTVAHYALRPVFDSFNRAFRED
ncbi:HlyD family type I secretion periplasmic adaptor subunit [Pseudaminobacter arsenicus]|uniref:Membrane fusion protein (MFP) family protein n=2 Tax=Borborobacter arsenicus TaxID=1851146 RepID=A0A432VCN7_9HYPH|nr:HlyD family type I secretion periplasmic adaptor subunit [Pseudaminobacter arsenicus]